MNKCQIPAKVQKLHDEATKVAREYLKAEWKLISIFEELSRTRGYLHYGVMSLTSYGIDVLKLSESAAINIVTVARKSIKLPKLKEAVESGKVSISKARRISAVITKENQDTWLDFAKTSSSRVIEKEIARVNPQFAVPEKLKYKTADRLELTLGISEKCSEKLKRVKELLSQKTSKFTTSEEAIEAALDNFIARHDPIEKAKRAEGRSEGKSVKQSDAKLGTCQVPTPIRGSFQPRTALPSVVKHAVTLRDLGQCTHLGSKGIRCNNRKWLDVHHIVPVSKGGSNDVSNLTTLCSAHHKFLHRH